MGAPSWIKDGFGIFLVVLCGALYLAGVSHPRPAHADGGSDGAKATATLQVAAPVAPALEHQAPEASSI